MKETVVPLDSRDEAQLLFGNRDQFLKEVRQTLGVQVIGRGDHILIRGAVEAVDQAEKVFTAMRADLRKLGALALDDVRLIMEKALGGEGRVINLIPDGKPEGQPPVPHPAPSPPLALRSVRARTEGQARYLQALRENDVIVCVGPAGTGKTWLAVAMAVSLLRQSVVKKIVLVRPAVEAGERLGFLPGDIAAKVNPYLRPLFDALNDLMDPEQVKRYTESDVIEIAPLAFMRGRTLNQAAIILDEAQNTTVAQMKMFLTRMGQGSKIIVTGDMTQVDLPPSTRSGLQDAVERLGGIDSLAIVELGESDIVRHPLVQRVIAAYESPAGRFRPGP
ncbi:MAG: PhoH family protein [Planctomycetes bacterium]|jgi:phosphate starvation-inducible PhoH-like protein|nr:PhoH family protein [Planctomycetota bacterium]